MHEETCDICAQYDLEEAQADLEEINKHNFQLAYSEDWYVALCIRAGYDLTAAKEMYQSNCAPYV